MPLANNSIKNDVLNGVNKFVHPKSRKCIAMVRKVKKDSKKERSKQEGKLKQSLLAEKLLWFQKHMNQEIVPHTIELTATLVENYIDRNNEELEQIQIKRSIGENRNKQHTGRADAIRMTKEREQGDYESCGLEIPNILNSSECIRLIKWDGNLKYLPNFKLCRFSKKHVDEDLKKKQRLELQENKSEADITTDKQDISTNTSNSKIIMCNDIKKKSENLRPKNSVDTLKSEMDGRMETE